MLLFLKLLTLIFLFSKSLGSHDEIKPYVGLPKDMVKAQEVISDELRQKLTKTASEVYEFWKSMETRKNAFREVTLNIVVVTEASRYIKVLPIDLYLFVDSCIKRTARIFLPDDKVDNIYRFSSVKRIHFSTVYEPKSGSHNLDIRKECIKRILYLEQCFEERVGDGRICPQLHSILLQLLDIQYDCLQESVNLNLYSGRYYDITSYIDLARRILEARFSPEQDVFQSINDVLVEFHRDLVELSIYDLDAGCPNTLEDHSVKVFAQMQLLKSEYPLAHHQICQHARLLLFQEPIKDVVPGKYIMLKKQHPIEDITQTFLEVYDELESRLNIIRDDQNTILVETGNVWKDGFDLVQKICVIQLYATTSYSFDILEEAEEQVIDEDDEISEDTLALVFQGLFIQISGLLVVARALLPPTVVKFLEPYGVFPQETSDEFHPRFLSFLNMLENNFRVIREKQPDLIDLIFKTIELCKALSQTLNYSISQGEILTVNDPGKWNIGVQLIIFSQYFAQPMDNLGYLKDFGRISGVVGDAIIGLVSVYNDSIICDRSNGLFMRFLIDACTWSVEFNTWEHVMSQIPAPYRIRSLLSKRFTLDAVIKRWGAQLDSKKEDNFAQPLPARDACVRDIASATDESEKGKSTMVQQKRKQKRQKKTSKKKRRSVESKQSNSSSDSDNEKLKTKEAKSKNQSQPLSDKAEIMDNTKNEESVEEKENIAEDDKKKELSEEAKQQTKMISPPPSPNKLNPKKTSLWNNASALLFPAASTSALPKMPIFEDPVEVKEMPPDHFKNLVDVLGYGNVNADPRDIAMGLIIVGQRIWTKHIQPLFSVLELNELGSLLQLFLISSEKFEAELAILKMTEPDLYDDLLLKAQVNDCAHLTTCLNFYRQRLAIAHPHVPRLPKSRLEIASRHLTVIEYGDGNNLDLVDKWRQKLGCTEQVIVSPISTDGRPKQLLGTELTEFILAFIGIQEISYLDQAIHLRNNYAHYSVLDEVYSEYLNYIFADHPGRKFLESLLY